MFVQRTGRAVGKKEKVKKGKKRRRKRKGVKKRTAVSGKPYAG